MSRLKIKFFSMLSYINALMMYVLFRYVYSIKPCWQSKSKPTSMRHIILNGKHDKHFSFCSYSHILWQFCSACKSTLKLQLNKFHVIFMRDYAYTLINVRRVYKLFPEPRLLYVIGMNLIRVLRPAPVAACGVMCKMVLFTLCI